jgi:formylmethanofuran dehydrogenase subunit D
MSCGGRLKVVLITGRSIEQGRSKDVGKFFGEYREAIAVCEINPADMEALGIPEGGYIDISSPYGSITVLAKPSPDIPSGVVFIPYGILANIIIPPDTNGTGIPRSKGLEVWVTPSAKHPPPDLKFIVKSIGGV